MNAIESPEMKQFRTVAAVVRTVALLGVLAMLAAIGANAPEQSLASLDCAFAAAPTGTLSDAATDFASTCATPVAENTAPVAEAKFGVPDAQSVLDPRAQPEAQPATF